MRIPSRSLALLASGLFAAAASATNVYVNSPLVTSYTASATVGGSKYRISNTNFDMTLDRGTDTGGPAGSFLQAGLGNHAFLNGIAYDFELGHVAGEGILFTMTRQGGASTTLSWGTFTTPPPGTNAATLNGIAPGAVFNSVQISSVATAGNRSADLSNLVFSSGALTLADGTFGSTLTTNAGSPATQLVVADVDLSQFDWSLSGTIVLTKQGTGGDETVRMRLSLVDAVVTIIPEPGTASLFGLGLFGLAFVGRKRTPR